MAIRKVGIYIKRNKPEAGALARQLLTSVRRRGLEALVPEPEAAMYRLDSGRPTEEVFAESDLLVVLGGDGTLLAAARLLGGRQTPILGVNLGAMGFMTEIRQEELDEALDLTLLGKARIVERMRLAADFHSGGEVIPYVVLNDVVVTKSALARIFDLRITVDDKYMNTLRADGLIVATPTGSTAYNLSAGGPIMHPQTKGLVITPICPHMMTNRPIVVPSTVKIEFELLEDAPVYVTFDGQEGHEMHEGDRIVAAACDKPVLMIKSPSRTYFEVLRQKLHYGAR
jgi:NAD+ kinase